MSICLINQASLISGNIYLGSYGLESHTICLRQSLGCKPHFPEVLGLRDPPPRTISAAQRLQFPAWSESKDHNSRHALRGGREARFSLAPPFPPLAANGKAQYCTVWRGQRRRQVASRGKRREVRTTLWTTDWQLWVGSWLVAAGRWVRRQFRAAPARSGLGRRRG